MEGVKSSPAKGSARLRNTLVHITTKGKEASSSPRAATGSESVRSSRAGSKSPKKYVNMGCRPLRHDTVAFLLGTQSVAPLQRGRTVEDFTTSTWVGPGPARPATPSMMDSALTVGSNFTKPALAQVEPTLRALEEDAKRLQQKRVFIDVYVRPEQIPSFFDASVFSRRADPQRRLTQSQGTHEKGISAPALFAWFGKMDPRGTEQVTLIQFLDGLKLQPYLVKDMKEVHRNIQGGNPPGPPLNPKMKSWLSEAVGGVDAVGNSAMDVHEFTLFFRNMGLVRKDPLA